MKKLFGTFVFLLIVLLQLQAQEVPLYSQYFSNPYLYNPGFTGSEGHASAQLLHRRQWMGIEGAPITSVLSFHTPVSEKVALGALISNDSKGVLQSSTALASFGYRIPFGEKKYLRMGLSAGVSLHKADLSTATQEQLAYLADWPTEGMRFEAAFGIHYRHNNFNAGISLPYLNRQRLVGSPEFSFFEASPAENWLGTLSYYLTLTPDQLDLEPLVLVQHLYTGDTRLEGGAMLYFKKRISAGATYRYNYGFTGLVGVKITPAIQFGYGYELVHDRVGGFSSSTHEWQLKIQLGPEKSFAKEVIHKPRFEL